VARFSWRLEWEIIKRIAYEHNVVFIQDIVQLERERFDATGTKSWRGGLLPLMEAA
jgi:hypothetical protein